MQIKIHGVSFKVQGFIPEPSETSHAINSLAYYTVVSHCGKYKARTWYPCRYSELETLSGYEWLFQEVESEGN